MKTANEISEIRYDEQQRSATEQYEYELASQHSQGIDAQKSYELDIAENYDALEDCFVTLDDLGVFPHLLYLANQNKTFVGYYLQRLAKAAIADKSCQEEIENDGIYEPLETNMNVFDSIQKIEKAIELINAKSVHG